MPTLQRWILAVRASGLDHQRRYLDQRLDRAGPAGCGGRAGVRAAGRHPGQLHRRRATLANIQAAINAGALSEGVLDNFPAAETY